MKKNKRHYYNYIWEDNIIWMQLHFLKNLKHAEIECPSCKKHERDCKKVYYDEWCAEFVCKNCGLVIKHL